MEPIIFAIDHDQGRLGSARRLFDQNNYPSQRESHHDFGHHRHLGRSTGPCLSCRRGPLFRNARGQEAKPPFDELWLRPPRPAASCEDQAFTLRISWPAGQGSVHWLFISWSRGNRHEGNGAGEARHSFKVYRSSRPNAEIGRNKAQGRSVRRLSNRPACRRR